MTERKHPKSVELDPLPTNYLLLKTRKRAPSWVIALGVALVLGIGAALALTFK